MDVLPYVQQIAGVLLLAVGCAVAVSGRGPTEGHSTSLGPLSITHPGPGLAIMCVGLLALVLPPVRLDGAGAAGGAAAAEGPAAGPGPPPPSTTSPAPGSPTTTAAVGPTGTTPGGGTTPEPGGVTHALVVDDVFGQGIDLDGGRPVPGGTGDLQMVVPGQLVPVTASRVAAGTATDLTGCDAQLARYADPGVDAGPLAEGASFCVRTDQGAVAHVRLSPWQVTGAFPPPLELTWTLWP